MGPSLLHFPRRSAIPNPEASPRQSSPGRARATPPPPEPDRLSAGIALELAVVLGDRGGIYGINLQLLPSRGPRLFVYSNPAIQVHRPIQTDMSGFSLGVGAQVNVARGHGDWSGRFGGVHGSVGPVSAGYFESADQNWSGAAAGVCAGSPLSLAFNESDYVPVF